MFWMYIPTWSRTRWIWKNVYQSTVCSIVTGLVLFTVYIINIINIVMFINKLSVYKTLNYSKHEVVLLSDPNKISRTFMPTEFTFVIVLFVIIREICIEKDKIRIFLMNTYKVYMAFKLFEGATVTQKSYYGITNQYMAVDLNFKHSCI